MAKLRHTEKFGTAPHSVLYNSKLSLKAKGMYTYLQAKPEDWDFSVERIAFEHTDGRDSCSTALRELEEHGFLLRKKYQNEKGFWDIDYQLMIPTTENPTTENPTKDFPQADNPSTNKEISNKKINNKEIEDIYFLFKEKIQPNARLTDATKKKVAARLKSFSVEEIKTAIENFSNSKWHMDNNGDKPLSWLCRNDEKMEYYINMKDDKPKIFSYFSGNK